MEGTSRGWLYTLGIILIVVGLVAIAAPLVATLAVTLLIGWVLIVSGVLLMIHSFSSEHWGRAFLRVLGGLVYLCAGVLILVYPLGGALTLTLLLAVAFLIEGICKIAASVGNRAMPNWGWMFVSGILALIIGALVWANWPSSSLWAVGVLVGINILFRGWTVVMLAAAM